MTGVNLIFVSHFYHELTVAIPGQRMGLSFRSSAQNGGENPL